MRIVERSSTEDRKMNAQQLKNAILQEAIEGRLVPQDPNDEPASILLEHIRAEKERLVKEGKLKKKDLEVKPISEDEIPFEIPEGWVWVRWGELGEYKKGPFGSSLTKSMFVPQSDKAVKVYEQKNAIQKNYSLGDYYISKEKYETMIGFTVRPGDIIVSCAGTIGETYLLPPEAPIGIINQALMRAKLHLDSIIPYWLLHFQYVLLIENKLKGSGSAIKNIPPFEVLKAMPVPIPPLAEQKRIVAKIEELLPKVEQYGKAQEELNKLNEELPERLKKSILQEAIEGRLVPQDPNDEPASVLLAKIREEKQQLVKEGKLKKKDLEEKPISEDEIPFAIPDSWEWVRLSSLLQLISDGTHKTPNYVPIGIPFLSVQNISSGKLTMDKIKYISEEEHNLLIKRVKPALGDILICRIGTLGKALKIYWDFEFSIFVSLGLLRPVNERLTDYIVFCINSPLGFNWIQNHKVGGGTHTYKINLGDMPNMLIPIPPFPEQKRIKLKIEQIFAEIDKLKK